MIFYFHSKKYLLIEIFELYFFAYFQLVGPWIQYYQRKIGKTIHFTQVKA